ncbi:ATP-grasp domain-containing protein, partial [Staphylococcus epidermidis]
RTFTLQFFIHKENNLYLNQIPPTPHNSPHYSIQPCHYSQFHTHILPITPQKLPQPIQLLNPTLIINLLPPHFHLLQNQFTTHPHSHIHIY